MTCGVIKRCDAALPVVKSLLTLTVDGNLVRNVSLNTKCGSVLL